MNRAVRGGNRMSSCRRLCFAGVLVACVLGCGDDDPEEQSGSFLALSYNVAGLPEGLSSSNPEVHTPLISPLLNGYDLVLVQEDWETPEPNPLAPLRVYHEVLAAEANHPFQSVPAPLPFGTDPDRPSALVSDGLNRFSRFPFGEMIRQRWQDCVDTSADCLSLKGFSVARTELSPGVCVDVYNLHGEAGNSEADQVAKEANMRAVADFMADFSAGRAVIVGGDFNLRRRRDSDDMDLTAFMDETGVVDVCEHLGLGDIEDIDKFMFRSNDRVTLDPQTCRFESDLFVNAEGGPLSDHEPLAVRFDWRAAPDFTQSCL